MNWITGVVGKGSAFYDLVRFPHTVFALPFAFLGATLAAGGWPGFRETFWILVAMVGARSAAMTFNRIVDLRFDRQNPRTASRPLPRGAITVSTAIGFLIGSCLLFFLAAAMLNRLTLYLASPALGVLLLYSYSKRFTTWTHLLLGFSLAGAPIGGWIAVRGTIGPVPILLGGAVMLWVAGFDIIYSCQDIQFDRQAGLHSLPCRWGVAKALRFAAALHTGMLAMLLALIPLAGLGGFWLGGVVLTAGLLAYEYLLVWPDDLSRVQRAFFTVNAWISFLLLISVLIDLRY